MGDDLTPKRERFCREYLIDLNGAAAARRAGYSARSAKETAYELLRDEVVASRIRELKAEREARTNVTADRVVEELARIAFVNLRDLLVWDELGATFVPSPHLSDDDAAAIAGVRCDTRVDAQGGRHVTVRLTTHDKLAALRELGKHLGIAERLDITTGGGALNIYLPDNRRDDPEQIPEAIAARNGGPKANGAGG